jgi:hypothetical protein
MQLCGPLEQSRVPEIGTSSGHILRRISDESDAIGLIENGLLSKTEPEGTVLVMIRTADTEPDP